MVPRLLTPARAMRSRTCADVIQPCHYMVLSVNKNVAFVWPPRPTLLYARVPAKLTF